MVEPSHVNCASGVIGRRCLSLAAYSALLAAPAYMAFRPSAATAQARSALDLMRLAPSVSYFAEIVKNHGLEEEFSAAGDFGFFIPLNGAIEQVFIAACAHQGGPHTDAGLWEWAAKNCWLHHHVHEHPGQQRILPCPRWRAVDLIDQAVVMLSLHRRSAGILPGTVRNL
jgi:hypothetical protein